MWKQFIVDLDALPQMDFPVIVGGIEYGRIIHTCTGVDVVASGRMDTQVSPQSRQIRLACAVAGQVHGEHPSPFATPKRCVIGVVIKDDQIARVRFQRNAAGKFLWWNTEKLF